MDTEQQEPHPPGVDREQDAQFLDRVDTALDRHKHDRDPPPPGAHDVVIHTQGPTPDANTGVAAASTAEAKQDALKPVSSAATPQFFGAGGPMCVVLFPAKIVSDLSVLREQDASI